MQGGRGVKIVIFVALQCKVTKNPRKTEDAWGKSFSRPPGGPEEQRTYELRTRLSLRRQAEHHRRVSFQEEYLAFLQRHGIEYVELYLWD